MTDADYADDQAFLANTPIQAEYLRHDLEQTAGGISFQINADKKKKSSSVSNKMEPSPLEVSSL